MSKITPNHVIFVGFVFGIVICVLLSILFPVNGNCEYSNLCDFKGYPFAFYRSGYEERDGGSYIGEILWLGLLADILFAKIFGFVISFIFKFVWSKIAARKLN